ncbi:hypothetical protein BFJ68_g13237 [Fusarium oxysporum]|uniref:Uncharacterized protein n=1 Tax=Fusarium oxysporum TaxID=5507 RepID=A0A420QEC2_FUSOX|nr:hypothetical protein BFJ68_g13237 [Fusarium oxysporum]RKL03112.1 hypothetical protein BFJ71_g4205 [Fusarium oxysporum]
MKYSAVAILSLAQGIVAAPSFLEKIKGSKPKALSTDQDISLSIKFSQVPMQREEHQAVKSEICWLLCADKDIYCPEGLYRSKKVRSPPWPKFDNN